MIRFITCDNIEWEIDTANFKFRSSKHNDWIKFYQFKPIRVGRKIAIETEIAGWASSETAVKFIIQ